MLSCAFCKSFVCNSASTAELNWFDDGWVDLSSNVYNTAGNYPLSGDYARFLKCAKVCSLFASSEVFVTFANLRLASTYSEGEIVPSAVGSKTIGYTDGVAYNIG